MENLDSIVNNYLMPKLLVTYGTLYVKVVHTLTSPTFGSYKISMCWEGDPRRETYWANHSMAFFKMIQRLV